MPLNKGTGKDKGFRALRSDSQGDGKRTLPRKGKGKGNGKEQAGRSRLGEGFVKKSLFNKERRTIPAWRNAGKEGTKGKGKGSSKGARRALKGKGQGKWSDVQSGYQSGGPKLWKGARSSKGKSKGKGKQWQKQRPAQSEEQRQRPSLSSRKGKGKGKRNGQGQFRAPDVMRVRRDGGIQKRQGKGGTGETYLGSTAIARALRQSKVEGSKFVEVGEDWCLRPDGGSFAWVRKANKRTDRPPNSRELRTEVASQTLVACHEQGYNLEGKSVPLNYIEKMKAGTHFVCADESRAVLVAAGKRNFTTSWKRAACGKSADLAIDRARAGLKVALVNAASAYHMGGGFMTGGRHALEESLCMQSTLFQSLEVAGRKAEQEHIGPPPCVGPKRLQDGTEESWHCHVPVKGAILSPSVEFFRAGTNEGYTFQSEATEVCAIVSVAMPNCNPDMRDCPVDAPKDMDEYKGLLVDKCHALCAAALKSGATVLVVPDVGCGVYGNHATDVGAALGGVLGGAFKGVFQEVLLAGTSEFQRAVEMAAATWSLRLEFGSAPIESKEAEKDEDAQAADAKEIADAKAAEVLYTKGEAVKVYSNSKGIWLNGIVKEVPLVDCVIDDYSIQAGAVQVAYEDGTGRYEKWITPPEVPKSIKKVVVHRDLTQLLREKGELENRRKAAALKDGIFSTSLVELEEKATTKRKDAQAQAQAQGFSRTQWGNWRCSKKLKGNCFVGHAASLDEDL